MADQEQLVGPSLLVPPCTLRDKGCPTKLKFVPTLKRGQKRAQMYSVQCRYLTFCDVTIMHAHIAVLVLKRYILAALVCFIFKSGSSHHS